MSSRRVWRYQRGNQNSYIEDEQTTQKVKQRSTYKTKDRETGTPLTTGGELRCSGKVSSSCYTSDKPGDKSGMRKGLGSAYDKWNIYVVICDTENP